MQKKMRTLLLLALMPFYGSYAQKLLSLKDAVAIAVQNYGTIQAKQNYAGASKALEQQAKRDYLPNLNFSFQQDYGTVNGQNGPLYGFGGLGAASSGLPLDHQNWNAAFGALYLANMNWEFFSFGKAKGKIKVANAVAEMDQGDLEQEIFQHKIKVASAYLNLLAAHQLTYSYQKNLDRADTVRRIVVTRALNGLVAGVDSSQANADYANAYISYTRSRDQEQQLQNDLMQLLGITSEQFNYGLDTTLITRVPVAFADDVDISNHPVLAYQQQRLAVSKAQKHYLESMYYPSFSLVGIIQTRGSGFNSGYSQDQTDFTRDYWQGIKPTRTNYLFGVGMTWNITQPFRVSKQVKSQDYITKGLEAEYELYSQKIKAQLELSSTKIRNALNVYNQAPVQVKAASDAFNQRTALYKNGLTNLVNVSQALYVLIRAETDQDIANNNVWQALLLRAAAAGNYDLFDSQL